MKKTLLAFLLLTACAGPVEVEKPETKPVLSAVRIDVLPDSILESCTLASTNGEYRFHALSSGSVTPVMGGLFWWVECMSPGHETKRTETFHLPAGDTASKTLRLEQKVVVSPRDSVGFLEVQARPIDVVARVDSMVCMKGALRLPFTAPPGLINPRYTVGIVDNGASCTVYGSAQGYKSTKASETPEAGRTKTVFLDFVERLTNPPPAVPPGQLRLACTIAGIRAEVRRAGDSTNVIRVGSFPTTLTLPAVGFYDVVFLSTDGKHYSYPAPPVWIEPGVNAGVSCGNQAIPPNPPPPVQPPPPPPTGPTILIIRSVEVTGPPGHEIIVGPLPGMEATVLKLLGSSNVTLVGYFITDVVLTDVTPGRYRAECLQPGQRNFHNTSVEGEVKANTTTVLTCKMRRKV